MSEEQLKAFLEKVNSDAELQEKLRATSPEAGLEIAKEAGFSITSEDIQTMQSATGGYQTRSWKKQLVERGFLLGYYDFGNL